MFANFNIEDNQFMKMMLEAARNDSTVKLPDRDPRQHRQGWRQCVYGPAGLSIPQYRPIDRYPERTCQSG